MMPKENFLGKSFLDQKIWIMLSVILFAVLFYLLKPVLTPFLVAALLAYLGDPLVNRLMHLKLPRVLAVTIVFTVIMFFVVSLFLFLIPLLARQLGDFINRLPEFLVWLQQFALPWINESIGVNISLDPQALKVMLTDHWQQAGDIAVTVWKTISQSGLAIIGWFAKLLLIPVVTFYLLCDWQKVAKGIRELLPRRIESNVMKLWHECDEVIGAFMRGQLFVMLVLAIIYWLGLSLIGLDLALMLGVLAGLLTIVPYLGLIVGILAASIAALVQFHDGLHIVYVVIIFTIGHLIENFALVPWLVGDRIGLHPVAVIFAVLAGGHLFGFTGVLLALPVAAVLMVLVRHLKRHYKQSEIYK